MMKRMIGFAQTGRRGWGRAWVWAVAVSVVGCNTGSNPFVVRGPITSANESPTLTILDPRLDFAIGQGADFVIRWSDNDTDDNAKIGFGLQNIATGAAITVASGIDENDDLGPDQFTVSTGLIPTGAYYVFGTIFDGSGNPEVKVFAETQEASPKRVILTLSGKGEAPPTAPPKVQMVLPGFNQSVAERDRLLVRISPTNVLVDPNNPPANPTPYDADSEATVYIVLDRDEIPDNDDVTNPGSDLIILEQRTIQQNEFNFIDFVIDVSLSRIPARPDGQPYFVRATILDSVNPQVHDYSPGTISVVSLASGKVNLDRIGYQLSGARFYGFNPGANLGSGMAALGNFNAGDAGDLVNNSDVTPAPLASVDDFFMTAQFGNPSDQGLIGEGYLVYGASGIRFGGAIAANSIAEGVNGCLFQGVPIRDFVPVSSQDQIFTNGITDVNVVPDISGDGRPEIIIGMSRVHGAWESMDFDPGDEDFEGSGETSQVVLTFRQGLITQSVDGGNPTNVSTSYADVDDLVISSCSIGACANGSASEVNGSGDLLWNNNGAGDTQWVLIKWANVQQYIPDTSGVINIPDLTATLSFRVFERGVDSQVFQTLTNFDEATTFDSFAVNGGAPEADVDYLATDFGQSAAFGTLAGGEEKVVEVDVTRLVKQLLEGELTSYDNDLRFILIPIATGQVTNDTTQVRSSEYTSNPSLRPTLTINYERRNNFQALGCYADLYVNNFTNSGDANPGFDTQFYYGGMALLLHSENRDSDGPSSNPTFDRLMDTAISIEYIGQSPNVIGPSQPRATDPNDSYAGIAGCRYVAGWYDWIDHLNLRQPPRNDLFGQNVASIEDMNLDGTPEIIVSSPRNELYLEEITEDFGPFSTHVQSTFFPGSIVVMPGTSPLGADYNDFRDKDDADNSTAEHPRLRNVGQACSSPTNPDRPEPNEFFADTFFIFAEDVNDFLGDGQSAGDMNLDDVPDIMAGAPQRDAGGMTDSGVVYIIQGRNIMSDIDLGNADNPQLRHPMVRIDGASPGDRIGHAQDHGRDVNGDRLDDIFIASPTADFGGVTRTSCGEDFNGDDVVTSADFNQADFDACREEFGDEVFTDDDCKAFDYDNDRDIDDADAAVRTCLGNGGGLDCCDNLADNGFIGVIFGGITIDGDFSINQLASTGMPGTIFFGAKAGDRAGNNVTSAGDFNQDGFGDLLITAPGALTLDENGRERRGAAYLIFGGPHLENKKFNLGLVGTADLPGMVFLSPYIAARPNEASIETCSLAGDVNEDGFDDILLGLPHADFINLNFPQGPDAPTGDAGAGRRRDTGDVYLIYGNNFGSNRLP